MYMQSESLESYVQAERSKVIMGGIMSPKKLPFDFCIPDGRDFITTASRQKAFVDVKSSCCIAIYVVLYQRNAFGNLIGYVGRPYN